LFTSKVSVCMAGVRITCAAAAIGVTSTGYIKEVNHAQRNEADSW
jgi:hypothetical protein